MGRRSDQHYSGLRGMCPSDAGKQQEHTQQKGNTQENSKDAYHDGLPYRYFLHILFLLLLLSSQGSSVTFPGPTGFFLTFYGRTGVPPINGFDVGGEPVKGWPKTILPISKMRHTTRSSHK